MEVCALISAVLFLVFIPTLKFLYSLFYIYSVIYHNCDISILEGATLIQYICNPVPPSGINKVFFDSDSAGGGKRAAENKLNVQKHKPHRNEKQQTSQTKIAKIL